MEEFKILNDEFYLTINRNPNKKGHTLIDWIDDKKLNKTWHDPEINKKSFELLTIKRELKNQLENYLYYQTHNE